MGKADASGKKMGWVNEMLGEGEWLGVENGWAERWVGEGEWLGKRWVERENGWWREVGWGGRSII